jgi:hypothetical protein
MPVVTRRLPPIHTQRSIRWPVSVVEANQSGAVWIVQRERVVQAVRSLCARLDTRNLEPDPIASFEVMDSAIECQQELQAVLVRTLFHIIS